MRKLLLIPLFLLLTKGNFAQELFCNVQIQHQQVQGVDPSVFEAMEKFMFDFLNTRKWTNFNFQIEEKLECTMILTIRSAQQGGDEFSGDLNVVLQRPIYGTDYNSVVINLVDNDVQFTYTPFQSTDFDMNNFNDNLTQILAFYAYLMLGLDFDTYSLYGGSQMYQNASTIATVAQNTRFKGWQIFEGPRNRAQLIENLLNSSYQTIRGFLYDYHRKGLDLMADDVEGGRKVVGNSLKYLEVVYKKRPNLYVLQVMLEAKRQEIINLYSEASPAEKMAMINMMKEVDPPNGTRYEEVMK